LEVEYHAKLILQAQDLFEGWVTHNRERLKYQWSSKSSTMTKDTSWIFVKVLFSKDLALLKSVLLSPVMISKIQQAIPSLVRMTECMEYPEFVIANLAGPCLILIIRFIYLP
jgi:hypothetical protein